MRVHVVMWKWHQENMPGAYKSEYVNIMCAMLARNMKGVDYRPICITDDQMGINKCETFELWNDHRLLANATKPSLPSCYRRLKLFDPDTQSKLGIRPGDRILSIDLDTVIVGPLRQIVERSERYLGWALPGTHHPKVFNGSFFMFTAGDLSEIWEKFDPDVSPKLALNRGFLGSDQSWLSMNLVGREGCDGLTFPVVASYPKNIRVMKALVAGTRIIFFHGKRKPWHQSTINETPWLANYWRE